MNYAKSQPDMAIMAVNTFVKDCEDPNPLIRWEYGFLTKVFWICF